MSNEAEHVDDGVTEADVGPIALDPQPPFVLPPLPAGRKARRYHVDPLTVDLIEGHLPDPSQPVDAVVSSDDNYLSHSAGVSAALWQAAGCDFAASQAGTFPNLTLGAVHVSTAGALPARFIFHAVTIDLDLNRTIIPAHLTIVYRKVARTAREHSCVTVALPLLAAGAAEISPTLSAAAFANAIRTAPNQGSLRRVLLYVLPEIYEAVASVLDSAFASRRRDPRWWLAGPLTYLPKEDARALVQLWRSLPADPDWRAAVASLLEAAVERAHRQISESPDARSERIRGSIAEVRMARNQLEHTKGRLTDEELAAAEKALRDLGHALSGTYHDEPADAAAQQAPAPPQAAPTRARDGAMALESSAQRTFELADPSAESATTGPAAATAIPTPARTEPLRALAPVPEARPEAEGGTAHVRALHQLLLARLSPAHLDALSELLERQGYRGDRDFRLLEHLVRQDPAKLLRQFFSVFDLRAILEKDFGLRPAPTLNHRQAAALVLRQLGFQPPRHPRGLLTAQAVARDAITRVRALQTPGTRLRGDVVEVGAQLEYVSHVLLRFVSQVVFDCPPEVLLRDKHPDGGLGKAGLGQLFRLVDDLDERMRKRAAPRLQMLGFSDRRLLPPHGKGALPDVRNHFSHWRATRRSSGDDLTKGREFLEGAQALLEYLAEPEHRVFPLMIVVRAIHYDRWGRRKISAETETGDREVIFTEKPLRPGEAYMMRPLSNPVRVDPLLVPAGDFGDRE